MTEQEYIDAADLARVRAASSVLQGMLCRSENVKKNMKEALRNLDLSAKYLASKIRIDVDVNSLKEPSK